MEGLSRSSKTSPRNSGKPCPLEASYSIFPCKMPSTPTALWCHCTQLLFQEGWSIFETLWMSVWAPPVSSGAGCWPCVSGGVIQGRILPFEGVGKSRLILLSGNSASWLTESPEAVWEDWPLKPRATSLLQSNSGFCFTFVGLCSYRYLKSKQRGGATKEWAPESAEFIPEVDKCLFFNWENAKGRIASQK